MLFVTLGNSVTLICVQYFSLVITKKTFIYIMKISRIDHLGIGVESIDAVLPYFENVLGLKCYAVEEVADQKVKTAFLKVGEVKLELLEPTSPESAVAKWLEKGGKGVHHVAFAVEDGVAEALVEAEGKEIRLIDKTPRPGAASGCRADVHCIPSS